MPAWITHLGHALPGPAVAQAAFATWMEPRLAPGTSLEQWRRFNARVGIVARHSVLDVFGAEGERYWPRDGVGAPGTAERSRDFSRLAPPLAEAAVVAALAPGRPGDLPAALAGVTDLVVATCTGAVAPGLDIALIQRLGLSGSVRRTVIGFMGCQAAIPALRVARDACLANPRARALVVCCELSSLHLQPGPDPDALLAACLFGDGASAALVQGGDTRVGLGLRFAGDATALVPGTGDQMSWYAGDRGFVLGLSPHITASLRHELAPLATALLARVGQDPRAPVTPAAAIDPHSAARPAAQAPAAQARWLVHPGGPRILDAAEAALDLPAGALDVSRQALAHGGNRSSGTILAILQDDLARAWRGPVGLIAFGPGLSAEALLLDRA
jgi:predicted naringenin-chalcone synthase